MCEVIITPEQLEDLERRGGDLERRLAQKQAKLPPEEALQEVASAYKKGLEASGEEEAERRMREKFDGINPPGRGD